MPSSFSDDSIDVVISVEVVEHLDDQQLERMLKDIYRVLKPCGRVIITTPNNEDLGENKTIYPECGCIFNRWQYVRTWSAQSLEKCLSESGFKTKLIKTTFFQSSSASIVGNALNLINIFLGKKTGTYRPHLIAMAEKHV